MTAPPAVLTGCPARAGRLDPADPAVHTDDGREAHALWRELRRHRPVDRRTTAAGKSYWSLTKYRDCDRVLRDHTVFTSERGNLLHMLGTEDPAGGKQMAVTDPPRHARMREPLQRALSMKSVDAHRERIRATVLRVVEPLADGGVFDFAQAMTLLPMAVTGVLMGIPEADWAPLTDFTSACVAPQDPQLMLPDGPSATLERAHRELFAYFQDLAHEREKALGDDLLSFLLTLDLGGRTMSPGEVMSNCYSLLLGANVTTGHVASSVLATQTHTGVLEDWAAHPELTVRGTEEALRWSSPAGHFLRYATRDTTLRGVRIDRGDALVTWLNSANFDEEVFTDPFTFDIRRRPNRHITFGAGAHFCVGHTVAKVTLRLLFAELLSRFEDFEVAGEPRRLYSAFVHGYTHLPITARVRARRGPLGY
ncbi:cytochrome P450 [Streptomyces sp. SGAir0957]